MEESRSEWQATVVEAQRLQRELDRLQRKYDECVQERLDFETKLFHARRLLESESKAKRQLVSEIEWEGWYNPSSPKINEKQWKFKYKKSLTFIGR